MHKTLYLHIGTHKTGTTALQRFLGLNRGLLGKHGVLYPDENHFGKAAGHFRMVYAVCPERPIYWMVPEDLGDVEQEWGAILNPPAMEKVLVSSESFFQCDRDVIETIKELTSGYDVKIVIYLRRQDELEMSWYNQGVKGIRRETALPTKQCRYPTEACFRRWEAAFGPNHLIVRPYEKEQFRDGSIYADFMQSVLGKPLTKKYVLPKKESNQSLHPVALAYKRMVNLLPLKDEQVGGMVMPLRRYSEHLRHMDRSGDTLLSPADRLAIIEQYQPFYTEIAKTYLGRPDGRLFETPLPDVHQSWLPYQLSREDALAINAFLGKDCPRAMEIVWEGARSGAGSDDPRVRDAAVKLVPEMQGQHRQSENSIIQQRGVEESET